MTDSKLDSKLEWLAARLREPSTYAGLASLSALAFHYAPPDTVVANITLIGTGIGGLLAFFLSEAPKAAKK